MSTSKRFLALADTRITEAKVLLADLEIFRDLIAKDVHIDQLNDQAISILDGTDRIKVAIERMMNRMQKEKGIV